MFRAQAILSGLFKLVRTSVLLCSSLIPILAFALPPSPEQVCKIKEEFDQAAEAAAKVEQELMSLQTGGHKQKFMPLDKNVLEPQLVMAVENLETAKQTLGDAETALEQALKAKADFDNDAHGGKRIASLESQIKAVDANVAKARADVANKKTDIDKIVESEAAIKAIETTLTTRMPALNVQDLDTARTQIDNEVARVSSIVSKINGWSESIKQRTTGETLNNVESQPPPRLAEIGLRCPEIDGLIQQLGIGHRRIEKELDDYTREQNPDVRSVTLQSIANIEKDLESLQQSFVPAAQSCRTALFADMDALAAGRAELERMDPEKRLRTLREGPDTLGNQGTPLEAELKKLITERKILETRVSESTHFKTASQAARDQAQVLVDVLSRHLDLLSALTDVDSLKADHDAAVQLKNDELALANNALAEANKLLNDLKTTRAELKNRATTWKSQVAEWKSKAELWKSARDEKTRTVLMAERQRLRDEKSRLVEINEACRKKEQTGVDLRSIRENLRKYNCFKDVTDTIGELDKVISGLVAGVEVPFRPLREHQRLVSLHHRATTAPGAGLMYASFNTGMVASVADGRTTSADGGQSAGSPKCAPAEDLDIELEELPPATDLSDVERDLAALEVMANRWISEGEFQQIQNTALIEKSTQRLEMLNDHIYGENQRLGQSVAILVESRTETANRTSCAVVDSHREKMQLAEAQAAQLAQGVSQELAAAESMGSICANSEDVEQIRSTYRSAIQRVAEIGRLEKQVVEDRNSLLKLKQELDLREKHVAELKKVIEDLRNSSVEARKLNDGLVAAIGKDATLRDSTRAARATLQAGLDTLRREHGIEDSAALPQAIRVRLSGIENVLGRMITVVDASNERAGSGMIEEIRWSDEEFSEHGRNWADLQAYIERSTCNFSGIDDPVERIGSQLSDASFELGLGADLPRLADDCAKKVACTVLLDDIHRQLQNGSSGSIGGKIGEARAAGCDMRTVDAALSDGKTVQDTVDRLREARRQCRFNEGLASVQGLASPVRNHPDLAALIDDLQRGAKTQLQVEQLVSEATAAAVRGSDLSRRMPSEQDTIRQHFDAAERLLNQASTAAAGYPCLVDRVNRFRVEYDKLKASAWISTAQAPVDELPEALGDDSGPGVTPVDELPGVFGAPLPPVSRPVPQVTPPPVAMSAAVLVMDGEPVPQPKFGGWTTVEDGRIDLVEPAYQLSATWNPLPRSMRPEGETITLTITATAATDLNSGIQIRGGGVQIERTGGNPESWGPEPLDLAVHAKNGKSDTKSMTVRIKPGQQSPGSSAWISVGVFYGLKVDYRYKGVQPGS